MRLHLRPAKLVAALLSVTVFLASLSGGSTPTRAGLEDCLGALAPIGSAEKLTEIAAQVTECGSEATTNPMMAVVMAVMIALRVNNAFQGADACNAMVDGAAGLMIGQGLKAIGIDNPYIEQVIAGSLKISDIPGIGDTLMHFTSCGCAVAGSADDIKAIAEDYLDKVKGCADFIGDTGEAVASGIFSSDWFGHGAANPGTVTDTPECPAGLLQAAQALNVCTNNPDGSITCTWDGHSYAPTCFCPGGSTASFVAGSKTTFYCGCPNGQGFSEGTCKPCPSGQALGTDGQCRAGLPNEVNNLGYWLTCGPNQVAYSDGPIGFCGPKCDEGTTIDKSNKGYPKCIPACMAGGLYSMYDDVPNAVYDPTSKQCVGCTSKGEVASFKDGNGKTSSSGVCHPCPTGTKFSLADKKHPKCVPACAEGSVLDGKGNCVDCNKQNKIAVSTGPGSTGICQACQPILEKVVGNACVPSKDCESWQKLVVNFNSGVAGGTAMCVGRCGPGEQYTPGQPGGTKTVILLNGQPLTTKLPPVLESCKPCSDKEVLDPSTNTCGPCANDQIWHPASGGKPSYCTAAPKPEMIKTTPTPPNPTQPVTQPTGASIPTGPAPGQGQPQPQPPPKPAQLACPPGRVPNVAGTRCVVDLDNDDSFRPGSAGGGGARPGGAGGASPSPSTPPRPAPGARP